MSDVTLATWTIYRHPLDHPQGYVVTEWHITAADPEPAHASTFRCDTLAQARTYITTIAQGSVRVDRDPHDEPQIVETWL